MRRDLLNASEDLIGLGVLLNPQPLLGLGLLPLVLPSILPATGGARTLGQR
jgi:hypothetical protein